jgi:hypothetical protein
MRNRFRIMPRGLFGIGTLWDTLVLYADVAMFIARGTAFLALLAWVCWRTRDSRAAFTA